MRSLYAIAFVIISNCCSAQTLKFNYGDYNIIKERTETGAELLGSKGKLSMIYDSDDKYRIAQFNGNYVMSTSNKAFTAPPIPGRGNGNAHVGGTFREPGGTRYFFSVTNAEQKQLIACSAVLKSTGEWEQEVNKLDAIKIPEDKKGKLVDPGSILVSNSPDSSKYIIIQIPPRDVTSLDGQYYMSRISFKTFNRELEPLNNGSFRLAEGKDSLIDFRSIVVQNNGDFFLFGINHSGTSGKEVAELYKYDAETNQLGKIPVASTAEDRFIKEGSLLFDDKGNTYLFEKCTKKYGPFSNNMIHLFSIDEKTGKITNTISKSLFKDLAFLDDDNRNWFSVDYLYKLADGNLLWVDKDAHYFNGVLISRSIYAMNISPDGKINYTNVINMHQGDYGPRVLRYLGYGCIYTPGVLYLFYNDEISNIKKRSLNKGISKFPGSYSGAGLMMSKMDISSGKITEELVATGTAKENSLMENSSFYGTDNKNYFLKLDEASPNKFRILNISIEP